MLINPSDIDVLLKAHLQAENFVNYRDRNCKLLIARRKDCNESFVDVPSIHAPNQQALKAVNLSIFSRRLQGFNGSRMGLERTMESENKLFRTKHQIETLDYHSTHGEDSLNVT